METNESNNSAKESQIKDELTEETTFTETEAPTLLVQCLPFRLHGSKLQNICRICLKAIEAKKASLLSLYNNKMLIDMLRAISSVVVTEVYPESYLPSYVCETCQSDVIYCYNFKLKCEKSDNILQSLLQDQIILSNRIGNVDSTNNKNTIPEELDVKNEVKEENNIDIEEEYLEDFSSDQEALCTEQNKNSFSKEEVENTVTDPQKLLQFIESQNDLAAKYTCHFCYKKFSKVKALRAHVTKMHSPEEHMHSCKNCKEVFNSEHDLQVHSAVHTTGPLWACNKCNKAFKARSQLRRHVQRHMQAKRFTCESCGKAFSELYALRRHSRVHTGEAREKKYACHLCDKRYSEKNQLRAHVARHGAGGAGGAGCVCAACGRAFASPRLLASHRRVHTDHKPHACSYCDKRFRHESTRNTHHRTHTGEKPYVCATCGKTFIQNSNLTLHMRTHTGEKPYSCDKCDRKFTSGSTLKTHLRRHTGEKPYECNVCGKRFARRDMSAHMRQHTGERPHACSACPKRFASAARLRDHCRMHTGEKPFECATCSQTFSTKSHLVKHLKKHQAQKKRDKREVVIVQHVDYTEPAFLDDKYVITDSNQIQQVTEEKNDNSETVCEAPNSNITLIAPEPMEVTQELVVQDDCDVKEILVVDNSQTDANYQSGNICINTDGVNYVNSDVNLVTVNEGTTVKLYQLDQSLVQIHSSGGQVTISKITSKMTANF